MNVLDETKNFSKRTIAKSKQRELVTLNGTKSSSIQGGLHCILIIYHSDDIYIYLGTPKGK
jgi:hypothetical protein